MDTQLLIEQLQPAECSIIQETNTKTNECFLSGVFMQAELENRNGRRYPLEEIARVVEDANKVIKESNGIFGELDHPQTLNINLDKVSHVITNLHMDGNNAIGKAKIIKTPMGEIARSLIESGVRLGVSSRGAGSVGSDGSVSGFNFVTVDIVATPSAPGAVPESVYESLMNDGHGVQAVSLAEQMKNDPTAQKFFAKQIQLFITDCLNRK